MGSRTTVDTEHRLTPFRYDDQTKYCIRAGSSTDQYWQFYHKQWSPSVISIQNGPCNQSNGWFDFVYMWHNLLYRIEFQYVYVYSVREKNNFDKASVGCDAANQARKRMDTAPQYHRHNTVSSFWKLASQNIFKDYPCICELIWPSVQKNSCSINSLNRKPQLECFFEFSFGQIWPSNKRLPNCIKSFISDLKNLKP